MPEKEMIEKVAHLEERERSNTKRIDEHDEQIKELQNTYSMLEQMNYRMGKVESNVEKINTKIDENAQEKGKKWDKFIDYIFYAILAIILGYIAYKLGLK